MPNSVNFLHICLNIISIFPCFTFAIRPSELGLHFPWPISPYSCTPDNFHISHDSSILECSPAVLLQSTSNDWNGTGIYYF